jgi:hypothetical protein
MLQVWVKGSDPLGISTFDMPVHAKTRTEALKWTQDALSGPASTIHYNDDSGDVSWLLSSDSILFVRVSEV